MTADPALRAWLDAIGRDGWSGVRLASPPPAADGARIVDAFDALVALLQAVEDAAAAAAATTAGAVRERLFEGLMAALDVLQPHRDAVAAIADSRDPGVGLLVARWAPGAIRRLAGASGIATTGLAAVPRLAALSVIAGQAWAAFRKDGSADLSDTMGAIDRLLAKAEQAETDGLAATLRLPDAVRRFLPGAATTAPDDPALRSSPDR